MQKSAALLGREVGLTAQELKHVLREEGYLDGEPGGYSVTEKGAVLELLISVGQESGNS